MVSDVWLPVRRLPASMNHALTQAEDGCWFGHLGAVLQADLPSPGTGWAKADAKEVRELIFRIVAELATKGVHLKFSGRGRDVSCLTPPARVRTSASSHTALTADAWRRSADWDTDEGWQMFETAIQRGASALGSCTNERVRQHQEAFTGARCCSLSPLQLAICGCFIQVCVKEGLTSPESLESVEN